MGAIGGQTSFDDCNIKEAVALVSSTHWLALTNFLGLPCHIISPPLQLATVTSTGLRPIVPELKMVIIVSGYWLLSLHLVLSQESFEAYTFLPAQVNTF